MGWSQEGGRIAAAGTPEEAAAREEGVVSLFSSITQKGSLSPYNLGKASLRFTVYFRLEEGSDPPHGGHLVLERDGTLQHIASLYQALVLAHQAVLMLSLIHI